MDHHRLPIVMDHHRLPIPVVDIAEEEEVEVLEEEGTFAEEEEVAVTFHTDKTRYWSIIHPRCCRTHGLP